MATPTVEIYEPDTVRDLVLREDDVKEVLGLGFRPAGALKRSWRRSIYRRAIKIDGQLAAAWGVCGDVLGTIGEPWLLTGPAVEKIPVSMLRIARSEILMFLDIFPTLSGYVAAEYTKAIRFLQLAGFTIEPVALMVPRTRAIFLNYWMKR